MGLTDADISKRLKAAVIEQNSQYVKVKAIDFWAAISALEA